MITYCKLINIECDNSEKGILECEKEDEVVLYWSQSKRDAIYELKKDGWLITKKMNLCPYCAKQFNQSNKKGE